MLSIKTIRSYFIHLILVLAISLCCSTVSVAKSSPKTQYRTPEGYWLAYAKGPDGKLYKRSIMHLTIDNNKGVNNPVMNGVLDTTFFIPGKNWSSRCVDCQGSFKGKSVLGLKILTGLTPSSQPIKSDTQWVGGTVYNLDANRFFSLSVQQTKSGKELRVKGCLPNLPFACKAFTWYRITSPKQLQQLQREGRMQLKTIKPQFATS